MCIYGGWGNYVLYLERRECLQRDFVGADKVSSRALLCVTQQQQPKNKKLLKIFPRHTQCCAIAAHTLLQWARENKFIGKENGKISMSSSRRENKLLLFFFFLHSISSVRKKKKDHTGKRQRRKTRSRVRAIKTRTSGQHGKAQRDSLTKRAQEMRWWWKTMKRENLEQDHFVLHSHYGTRPRWCVV